MSADNFVYVDTVGDGRFGVWDNLFASDDDPRHGVKPVSTHATFEEAVLAAHRLATRGYYEYGVQIGCEVPDGLTATSLTRPASRVPRGPEFAGGPQA